MWYMMKGSALLYWSITWMGILRIIPTTKFCWIVDKAKVNGTEEFEDYEPSLTKEQGNMPCISFNTLKGHKKRKKAT